jgi:hypothetical protein
MKLILLLTLVFGFECFAQQTKKEELQASKKNQKPQEKQAEKPQEKPQEPQKATVLILDKLYTNRTFYEIQMGQTLQIDELDIQISQCIENLQKKQFVFLNIKSNKDDIVSNWVPISKYTSTPITHKRFDISVISCNFYSNKS